MSGWMQLVVWLFAINEAGGVIANVCNTFGRRRPSAPAELALRARARRSAGPGGV